MVTVVVIITLLKDHCGARCKEETLFSPRIPLTDTIHHPPPHHPPPTTLDIMADAATPAPEPETDDTRCGSCRAEMTPHCSSKNCPWDTCINPACRTTWHRRLGCKYKFGSR